MYGHSFQRHATRVHHRYSTDREKVVALDLSASFLFSSARSLSRDFRSLLIKKGGFASLNNYLTRQDEKLVTEDIFLTE